MKNTITASIEFYFKGEKLSSSIELDLDQLFRLEKNLPNLYPVLAKAIELDPYSYEYEMMHAETIAFSSSKQWINEEIINSQFDFQTLKTKWQAFEFDQNIQSIIEEYFTNDELKQIPQIKQALIAAFNLEKPVK